MEKFSSFSVEFLMGITLKTESNPKWEDRALSVSSSLVPTSVASRWYSKGWKECGGTRGKREEVIYLRSHSKRVAGLGLVLF